MLYGIRTLGPVPRPWQAFDDKGRALDQSIDAQLRSPGQEVFRASHQMNVQGYCDYSIHHSSSD